MASSQNPFDYIIVGGGTAGLVVAARLSENANIKVAVIEAGKDVSSLPDVLTPVGWFRLLGNPNVDWGFFSTPQKGANNRPIHLPRGKALGGSSIINGMQFGRAPAVEYDGFEKLGCKGWNWNELLTYFKKSEGYASSPDDGEKYHLEIDPNVHGTSGPLKIGAPLWASDMHNPFIQACQALGVNFNPKSNAGDATGVFTQLSAIDRSSATRTSSASAYYDPNKSRDNLVVFTDAQVVRIKFKSSNLPGGAVAEGVEYIKEGQMHIVLANKEVILSAGAYQTPQILELSGIGDERILKKYGIPVVQHLPGVGNNLQVDHVWCTYTAEMDPKYESLDVLTDPARLAKEGQLYATTQRGMLSAVNSAFAYLPVKNFVSDDKLYKAMGDINLSHHPEVSAAMTKTLDMQKQWMTNDQVPHLELAQIPIFVSNSTLGSATVASTPTAEVGKRYFSLFVGLLHPFSRGSVHISSADPLSQPAINPHFLDNPVDVAIMVEGFKFARKLVGTDVLKDIVGKEIFPGPNVQTDAQIEEYVRNTMMSTYHPIATASMLPRDDGGVVDPNNMKVYGTKNLRVVDASIIPIQLACKTQATIYGIAEKAADIIKADI